MVEEVTVPIRHIIRCDTLRILWKDPDIPMYKWLFDNVPRQSIPNKIGPNKKNWMIIKHSGNNDTITIRFHNAPPEVILMFKLTWGDYEYSN
jgi:hypothetical protein